MLRRKRGSIWWVQLENGGRISLVVAAAPITVGLAIGTMWCSRPVFGNSKGRKHLEAVIPVRTGMQSDFAAISAYSRCPFVLTRQLQ